MIDESVGADLVPRGLRGAGGMVTAMGVFPPMRPRLERVPADALTNVFDDTEASVNVCPGAVRGVFSASGSLRARSPSGRLDESPLQPSHPGFHVIGQILPDPAEPRVEPISTRLRCRGRCHLGVAKNLTRRRDNAYPHHRHHGLYRPCCLRRLRPRTRRHRRRCRGRRGCSDRPATWRGAAAAGGLAGVVCDDVTPQLCR